MSRAIELPGVQIVPEGKEWTMQVTLNVDQGEFVALVGPTRSGKSVLLELCAGLVSPASGRPRVLGHDLGSLTEDEWSELRTHIGTVLQQPGLMSNMTVFNNVALPVRYHRAELSESEIQTRVMTQLEALGISHLRDRFPSQLTQGEVRCAAIARSLVLGQELLLLDDPIAGLDAEMTRRLAIHLILTRQARSLTVLVALRRYSELLDVMDRVAFLRDGQVHRIGRPQDLIAAAGNEVKGYLTADGAL